MGSWAQAKLSYGREGSWAQTQAPARQEALAVSGHRLGEQEPSHHWVSLVAGSGVPKIGGLFPGQQCSLGGDEVSVTRGRQAGVGSRKEVGTTGLRRCAVGSHV